MSDGPGTEGNPPANTHGDQGAQGNGPANSTVTNTGGAGQGAAHAANPPVQIPDFAPLMTAIAALPEQLAKSVKEAIGTPAKPADQPAKPAESDSKGSDAGEGSGGKGSGATVASKPTGEPGKRRSFADWWVNG